MSDAERNSNRASYWASTFVEELYLSGCRTACVSPGSRSTPLTMALARHGKIRVFTLIDERSCAFFALGHAKAGGAPVALVCTSGTAAVNFHPAVVEASYGQVPLIVLTADRPPELRDTGASQSIDQLKLYGSSVRWFFEVGTPELTPHSLRHLRGLAARAVFQSLRPPLQIRRQMHTTHHRIDFLIRRIAPSHSDVVADTGRKQKRLLIDKSDVTAQSVERYLRNRLAIDKNRISFRVKYSGNQLHERAFSGTDHPNQRHRASRFDF